MPMSPATWGAAVSAAVSGLSVPPTTVMTPGDLTTFWTAITTEHVTHLSSTGPTGGISVTGTTLAHAPGGPAPLTTPPVVIA